MCTSLILARIDEDATALDWSVTTYEDDPHAVMAQTWMTLSPGDYGTVSVPLHGDVCWTLWDARGQYLASGHSVDERAARLRVESLLAERSSR